MFKRSWVRILAMFTGQTRHFNIDLFLKKIIVSLKRLKINEKEAGVGPFFLKKKICYL